MQRIDQKRLRQRILLNLIGDNFVIFPLGVGVSLAFATWAFNLEPQLLFWFISGMVGVLGPIGGLVAMRLDEIPPEGATTEFSGLRFTVEDADERRIKTVKVEVTR